MDTTNHKLEIGNEKRVKEVKIMSVLEAGKDLPSPGAFDGKVKRNFSERCA
jgi:hypothetical protein